MSEEGDEPALTMPEAWERYLDGPPGSPLRLDDEGEARAEAVAVAYEVLVTRGVGAAEDLARMAPLDDYVPIDDHRAAGEALSVVPTDEAFVALVERATQTLGGLVPQLDGARHERVFLAPLDAAVARFPARAVRILAARVANAKGEARARLGGLLARAALGAPDVAREVATTLDDEARREVEALLALADVAVAPREALPDVLREPPWTRAKKKPKRAKPIALAPIDVAPRVDWRGDERARWTSSEPAPDHLRTLGDRWAEAAERRLREGSHELPWILLHAPREVAADVARRWDAREKKLDRVLPAIVARLEADALPLLERCAQKPWGVAAALPIGAPSLAPAVAAGLGKNTARDAATAWLARHPEAAAIGLVPNAAGKAAKPRREARAALALLDPEVVRGVAARYGDEAIEALRDVLEADPLDAYPARLPTLPAFSRPETLPAPELRSGAGALDVEARSALATMLAFSRPGAPYPGVARVREACTPASLAAFSWALFEAWLSVGAPTNESWAFLQLGWLGDDEVAYRLLSRMKQWPGQGQAKRAERGLDVLAEMESDVALVLVHQLAQKGRGSLKKNAKKKLTRLAAIRGLGPDELEDRLAPTLDLDPDGSTRLDYGPRAFTVGFDAELSPYVIDDAGKPRASLPAPGKRDDPDLAPAAHARFKALKKAVRAVAKTQVLRLERAMASERRWRGADLRRYVVAHPLLVHLARRLVFATYSETVVAFRVDEEGATVDADDAPVPLPDDATVGIAHPIDLDPAVLARWREVFEDYELLQPFEQLARAHHRVARVDRLAALEARLGEPRFEAPRIAKLEERGWIRGPVGDGAMFHEMLRATPAGPRFTLHLDPGVVSGMVHLSEPQAIAAVRIAGPSGERGVEAPSDVAFSELLRDLDDLRA